MAWCACTVGAVLTEGGRAGACTHVARARDTRRAHRVHLSFQGGLGWRWRQGGGKGGGSEAKGKEAGGNGEGGEAQRVVNGGGGGGGEMSTFQSLVYLPATVQATLFGTVRFGRVRFNRKRGTAT